MSADTSAFATLKSEAESIYFRLENIRPFETQMPMVAAAMVSPRAQAAIKKHFDTGKKEVASMLKRYIDIFDNKPDLFETPASARKQLTTLRLKYNAILTHFDIYSDVLAQRGENQVGVMIAGLDEVAEDALRIKGNFYDIPPIMCYLERGLGAAIRRQETRLPGGYKNPVSIIHIPRERMGTVSIASSLVHEVGHQGAALLDLVNPMRKEMGELSFPDEQANKAWDYFRRWISEIIADFWAVAILGITSTLGLIHVASLPRPFVFKTNEMDPHPMPWIRVKLSCVMGNALYPHPQWYRLARMWNSLYPTEGLQQEVFELTGILESAIGYLVKFILNYRPAKLGGRSLYEIMPITRRSPGKLAAQYKQWNLSEKAMYAAAPTYVFAVIGQAKYDGKLCPGDENRLLSTLLERWARRRTSSTIKACA